MKKWCQNENGSMAVYAIVMLLSFLIILSGLFLATSSVRKNQLKTLPKIKQAYEKILEEKQEIVEKREAYENNYIQTGLVAHYDAINNTGSGHDSNATIWKDISGNGNDLALFNFEGTATSGWSENGLNFDGSNDYAYISNNPIYNNAVIPENLTIEIISSKNTTSVYGAPLSFDFTVNSRQNFPVWTAVDDYRSYDISYHAENLFTDNAINYKYEIPLSEYPIKTAKSISYGKDGTKYFTYLNATKKDEQVIEGTYNWFENGFYLGRPHSNNYYFNGTIQSVRIYNKTLTQVEIDHNYQLDKTRYGIEQ